MKKFAALFLVLTFIVACAAACKKNPTPNPDITVNTTSTEATTTAGGTGQPETRVRKQLLPKPQLPLKDTKKLKTEISFTEYSRMTTASITPQLLSTGPETAKHSLFLPRTHTRIQLMMLSA